MAKHKLRWTESSAKYFNDVVQYNGTTKFKLSVRRHVLYQSVHFRHQFHFINIFLYSTVTLNFDLWTKNPKFSSLAHSASML